jgi:polysaccharide biosynthesis transport protein
MQAPRKNFEIAKKSSTALAPQSLNLDSPNFGGKPAEKHAKLKFLREWKRIIFRHLWLILALIALIVPIAAVQAYRAKPIYQAWTTIEVRPETSSLSKSGEMLVVDSNDNTKAESFIIRSVPVVKRVVVDLNLDNNPRFMAVNTNRTVFEAIEALRGKKPAPEDNNPVAQASPKVTSAAESGQPPADAIKPISSDHNDRKRLDPFIQTLINNLKVEPMRDTRLIRIAFTHTDPELAAEVANGVAKSFMEQSFESKTARFSSTSNWLDDSTAKLKAQMQQAEQKLATYSRENNIFSLEGKENLTTEKMARLHDQYMRAETDLLLKKSLYEEVKQGRVDQLPESFTDAKTAEMQKNLNSLALKASELSVKYGARHPMLQEIQQQMSTIKTQIDANRSTLEEKLKADYERALRDDQSLAEALNRAKGEAVQQNQAAIQYSVLQQDLATAKALYTDFLNKTSQAKIQRAEQYNNVRMIEEAEPPTGPIGPKRKQTIVFGLLISIALGIGLAYMLENLNTTVRTLEDIGRTTQLPVLAVIPKLTDVLPVTKRNAALGAGSAPAERVDVTLERVPTDVNDGQEPVYDRSRIPNPPILVNTLRKFSAAAEAYRILRTSLLLSTAEQSPKRILITSGQPGDGKTTTVLNTAIALSQLKAEVIIVDCDMRKPRVHKLAQIPKGEGLSTYLTRGGELYKYIHRTPVPHLSILPCGFIPPNPSELISSEKMKDLMRLLARGYDYVILDSPPLVGVTDSMILSTLVDGVIIVARSGMTRSELLQRAIQDLSGVGAKMLGVILNDLNLRHESFDYYDQYARHYSEQSSYGDTNSGIEAFR